MEGERPRPGLPPEPTGPLPAGADAWLPWRPGPLLLGGRRRPWARRPAVLLGFQRAPLRLPGCREAGPESGFPGDRKTPPLPSPLRGEGAAALPRIGRGGLLLESAPE